MKATIIQAPTAPAPQQGAEIIDLATAPIVGLVKQRMMPSNRFERADHKRSWWSATVASFEDYRERATQPWYWRLVGQRVSVGDVIEMRDDVLTFWALLLVLEADSMTGELKLTELMCKEMPQHERASIVRGGYRIEYAGITDRWQIVRVRDGMVMKRGIKTSADAEAATLTEFAGGA